ncbi:MAG: hypothetical protein RBT64_13220 [Trichloromonas sp.]|nr:hypothetical protein [Trichloromonas sp.]
MLAEKVRIWREAGYPCEKFPAIGEILRYQTADDSGGTLRFLRPPQFRALEVYWYLRLVANTRIFLISTKPATGKKLI